MTLTLAGKAFAPAMFRRQWIMAMGLGALGLIPVRAHEYYALQFMLIHPWTEPTLPGQNEARVRFRLQSITDDDRLIGAQFAFSRVAELRSGIDNQLPPVPWIDIRRGESMNFSPEGFHVLLKDLAQPLYRDRSYPLSLRFERSGTLTVMMSMSSAD
ncbi:MAG: copper chaperone PCu(A)C [Betaproteobacteria bacterium]|nr:copper chaperone PCu(A)C [Betaproteobacteria bacterium]NDA52027.1 copper chaperone PCu(A)C [Betaproteobacteria bacterium]NDF73608.1 copper chaperone PCu(A)C [Betaproteobacteria bacterium]NDF92104.1 copper chaperone PCu(A)C [Betaproteobacteria bacterium]NDH42249.1 copper chaperone PCu(A)C [Betaproteobacteria bacterium]